MQVCTESREEALAIFQPMTLSIASGRTIYVRPSVDTFAFVSGCFYTPYQFDNLVIELTRVGAHEVAFEAEGLECLIN